MSASGSSCAGEAGVNDCGGEDCDGRGEGGKPAMVGISTVVCCDAFGGGAFGRGVFGGGGALALAWTSDRNLSSRVRGNLLLVLSLFLGGPLNGHVNFGMATLGKRDFGGWFVAFGGTLIVGGCMMPMGCFG